jgi:hypothetical protein
MLLGKRVLETAKVELMPIVMAGKKHNNIRIVAENGEEVIALTIGIKNHSIMILTHDFDGDGEKDKEFIPYFIESKYSLDSYTCDHIQRLLSDIIWYNTGLVIDAVGLYYDDKVLGCGVLENNRIEITESIRVKKTPISLAVNG